MVIINVPQKIVDSLVESMAQGPIQDNGMRLLTEKQVGQFKDLKINIFAKEHPPPHFHIINNDKSACYRISDCKRLHGNFDSKWERNIKKWHSENKDKLITVWNEMRPSDCPVGEYRE